MSGDLSVVAGPSDGCNYEFGGCSYTHFKIITMTERDCVDLLIKHGVLNNVALCERCGLECLV